MKTVAIIGTFDTKGEEFAYVKTRFEELGINTIDDKVVEFFNPLLLVHAIRVFAQKLSEERKHPLTVRRYMWKLKY